MKKSVQLLCTLILTGLLIVSCSKEDTSSTIDTEDIAEDIAYSLSAENNGITSEFLYAAEAGDDYETASSKSAQTTTADTLIVFDTNYYYSSPAGATTAYDFSLDINYGYVYQTGLADYMYYNSTIEGTVDAPRIYVSENRVSYWTFKGFEISYSDYTLNGTINRQGTSELKVRSKSKISSTSVIDFSDIKIDKSNYTITGSLNWVISGTINSENFQFEISVEYLGNGQANIIIEGIVYTIYISTGEFV